MTKKITRILVDGEGWFYASESEPIQAFYDEGVLYYSLGNLEFNGRYVIQVVYEDL